MKTRTLLSSGVLASFMVLGWMLIVVKPLDPSTTFALNILGDVYDIVHSGSGNSSEHVPSASDPGRVADMPPAPPPWTPFYIASRDIFANTFVVSLPHRTDRRIGMKLLRDTLAVNWTYVDATAAGSPTVSWLVNCIRSTRAAHASSAATTSEDFAWPESVGAVMEAANETAVDGSVYLWCPRPDNEGAPADEDRIAATSVELSPLTCATRNFTTGPPYDPSLPPHMLLTPAKVACWHSHLRVLERFAHGQMAGGAVSAHEMVLVLEDDVNVESDVQSTLPGLMEQLPPTWDMLFLGASTVISCA